MTTATIYTDEVFAALDRDHGMVRIAGGNETEVYQSDCGRYAVKVKGDLGSNLEAARELARQLNDTAQAFRNCLGPRFSIATHYLVAKDSQGHAQVVAVQPFLTGATPLYNLDYGALEPATRQAIATQLREIIRRSLQHFKRTGSMPDLYGRSSTSRAERRRTNAPHMLPRRLWSFLVARNLLRSHNLLLLRDPEPQIVLVDYDPVRQSQLYRRVYYAVRWLLFLRDHALIATLK